jgi:hypothetical protein
MISSLGTFSWGEDGICLSDTSAASFEASPSVVITENQYSIIAWNNTDAGTLIFQMISPSGSKLWGTNGIVFDDPVRNLSYPVLAPTSGDQAIILYKSSSGSGPYAPTWLYAGLLDSNGGWGWDDTPILVYDSAHMSSWSYPEAIPDGEGGAVFSWYDALDSSTFDVWVQHVDADGNVLFPFNGAQASTNSDNRLHMYPSSVSYASGGQTLVFWVEENDNQDQYGVYGQLFSSSGDRLWTDGGLELVPMGSSQISFVNALGDPGGVFFGYFQGAYSTAVRVLRIGYDGSEIWGPVTLSAASLGGKDDLVDCFGIGQGYVCAWCDNRNDYGIYAQRINQDGTLGPGLGIGDGQIPSVGSFDISPNPSCGSTTLSFGMEAGGFATLAIYDMAGRLVSTLLSGDLEQGLHSVSWDGGLDRGTAAGIYLARLDCAGHSACRRLVLLR